MIPERLHDDAVRSLHRLIIHARWLAYKGSADKTARFLDSMELLPTYLLGQSDNTEDFLRTLRSLRDYEGCIGIYEDFLQRMSDRDN
jgi:hypothetical protein